VVTFPRASRRGASKMGCLFSILIVVAIAYFGIDFGKAYWANAEFKDEMKQEIKYHSDQADDQIRAHMKLVADSLGLPDSAGVVTVTRDPPTRTIAIDAQYDVTVKIPGYERVLHFAPHATDTY
jgi:hypothetical protein